MSKIDIIGFYKRHVLLNKINNFKDFVQLSSYLNREIYLDIITPQVAEEINKIIYLWNRNDDIKIIETSKRKPIKIYINSSGGDFSSMLIIMDTIKLSKTPVYTFNIGSVQKEAFFIFCMGDKRYCYPSAYFLFEKDLKHLENDEKKQNEKYYSFYQKQLNNIKETLFEKTKINENEYNKHAKGSWWIDKEDSFKYRICTDTLNIIDS